LREQHENSRNEQRLNDSGIERFSDTERVARDLGLGNENNGGEERDLIADTIRREHLGTCRAPFLGVKELLDDDLAANHEVESRTDPALKKFSPQNSEERLVALIRSRHGIPGNLAGKTGP
jgi:hypothetical protein